MKVVARLGAAAAFAVALSAKATPVPSTEIEELAKLSLNSDGLAVVAAAVELLALRPIVHAPVADLEQPLPLGGSVTLKGIDISATFGPLHLAPKDSGLLHATTTLKAAAVHVSQLIFKTELLGMPVVNTCSSVDLSIADKEEAAVAVAIGVQRRGPDFALSEAHASLHLSADQIAMSGPASCAPVDDGGLTAVLLQLAVALVQPQLEEAINQRLAAALPQLEQQLNQAFHRPTAITLPPLPGATLRRVWLQPKVAALHIDTQGVQLAIGGRLSVALPTLLGGALQSLGGGTLVGQLGINPALLTQAFELLYPQGTPRFDLSEDSVPGINGILSVQSAAAFWPDLLRRPPTKPYVRLQAQLRQAPEVIVEAAGAGLRLHLNQLELTFLVNFGGQWIDYFVMQVTLDGRVAFSTQENSLSLRLSQSPELVVTGHWVAPYQPADPRFESDVAQTVLQSLLDIVYRRGPLATVALPQVAIAGRTLSFGQVTTTAPYLTFDLNSRLQ